MSASPADLRALRKITRPLEAALAGLTTEQLSGAVRALAVGTGEQLGAARIMRAGLYEYVKDTLWQRADYTEQYEQPESDVPQQSLGEILAEASAPLEYGWQRWGGGMWPGHSEAMVEVRTAGGAWGRKRARDWLWKSGIGSGTIVQWRYAPGLWQPWTGRGDRPAMLQDGQIVECRLRNGTVGMQRAEGWRWRYDTDVTRQSDIVRWRIQA